MLWIVGITLIVVVVWIIAMVGVVGVRRWAWGVGVVGVGGRVTVV
jgi:hypothetical protein